MARPNRIRELAQQRNLTTARMVVDALNRNGTVWGAAKELGVSYQALWAWVHKNCRKTYRWTCDNDFIEAEIVSDTTHAQPADAQAQHATKSPDLESGR